MSAGVAGVDGAAGFTLIEALVALAILAVSAISLLTATEAYVARIAGVEARALAQIAAENHLAEMGIGTAGPDGEADLLGRRFAVAATSTPTADPDLVRVDLAVMEAGTGARFGGVTGFLDTGGARP